MCTGSPNSPDQPETVDVDHKSMTLRWEKPKEDSICYYIVQQKEYMDSTGWQDALITNDQNCRTTQDKLEVQVPGLREGRWYQFRVIAVNKAGKSDPSPETEPHVCKAKGEFIFLIAIGERGLTLPDYHTTSQS